MTWKTRHRVTRELTVSTSKSTGATNRAPSLYQVLQAPELFSIQWNVSAPLSPPSGKLTEIDRFVRAD